LGVYSNFDASDQTIWEEQEGEESSEAEDAYWLGCMGCRGRGVGPSKLRMGARGCTVGLRLLRMGGGCHVGPRKLGMGAEELTVGKGRLWLDPRDWLGRKARLHVASVGL